MANVKDVKPKAIKIPLLDGKDHEIKFDLNALAELEDKYGSVDAAFETLDKSQSIKSMRTILWAGLLHEDENLTEREVGAMIDFSLMNKIMEALNGALGQDMPDEKPALTPTVAVESGPNV